MSLLLLGSTMNLFSSEMSAYDRAVNYLEDRGEVYFCFYPEDLKGLNEIELGVSIDKIDANNGRVYAYSNSENFPVFVKSGIYYETLTPPGLQGEKPKMSDYSDRENREWDKYPTYDGYVNLMNEFATKHPQLCEIVEFGQSIKGKKLLVAKISKNVSEHEKEPAFFYQGTIHGDEVVSYVVLLRMIDYLLTKYGSDNQVTKLLDNMEIWINPNGNPDGTYNKSDNSVGGAIRKNANYKDLNRNFPCPSMDGKMNPNNSPIQKETIALIKFLDENPISLSGDLHSGAVYVCYPWGCWTSNAKPMPDNSWWKEVSSSYVDIMRGNSNQSYWKDNSGFCKAIGWDRAGDWYLVVGERMNHATYYQGSRALTLELGKVKILPASELDASWSYNSEALLDFMEQAMYGIHGTVTDSITGDPIKAKIFVEGHDKYNTHVYSYLPHGDFYRYISPGKYNLKITAVDDSKYNPVTITDVTVKRGEKVQLDVKLWDGTTGTISNDYMSAQDIFIIQTKNGFVFKFDKALKNNLVTMYNVHGRKIKQIGTSSGSNILTWDGADLAGNSVCSGCYVIHAEFGKHTVTRSFYIAD